MPWGASRRREYLKLVEHAPVAEFREGCSCIPNKIGNDERENIEMLGTLKKLTIAALIVMATATTASATEQRQYVLLHVPPHGTRYYMAVGPLTKEKCDQWRLASRDRDSKYILCLPLDSTGVNDE
jgi:hypothetical protein